MQQSGYKPIARKVDMNTAVIFKEELNNPAIWDTIIRDLELPPDTDEITVKAVCFNSESKRKESRKKAEKSNPKSDFEQWFKNNKNSDGLQRHYKDVLEQNPNYELCFKDWAKKYYKNCVDV